LDRPWPPVIAAWIPVICNVTLTLWLHNRRPQWIGLGASLGLLTGFLVLFAMAHTRRRRWLQEGRTAIAGFSLTGL
jgi:hypothetical protein